MEKEYLGAESVKELFKIVDKNYASKEDLNGLSTLTSASIFEAADEKYVLKEELNSSATVASASIFEIADEKYVLKKDLNNLTTMTYEDLFEMFSDDVVQHPLDQHVARRVVGVAYPVDAVLR